MSTQNQDAETVDISNDDWSKVISDPNEYKNIVMDLLKNDNSVLCQDIYLMLMEDRDKIKNDDLDMKLRELSTIVPYNILVPLLREQLGLCIQTDKSCIDTLEGIKSCLKDSSDQAIIDQIIGFINDEEMDESVVPEIDLLAMIEKIPVEKFPAIFNCIDYITEISEFGD